MADEFKLSYTASEINNKLQKVGKCVTAINGTQPDSNGNIEVKPTKTDIESVFTGDISTHTHTICYNIRCN